MNVRYDDSDDGELSDLSVVYSYSPIKNPYSHELFEGEINNRIKEYLENFHDPIVYTNKHKGELMGLFSFMEKMEIPFYYMFDNVTLKNNEMFYNELDKTHKLIIEKGVYTTSHFCHKYNLTIKDDTKGFSCDTHPGYLGYKQFSEVAIKFLETRLY